MSPVLYAYDFNPLDGETAGAVNYLNPAQGKKFREFANGAEERQAVDDRGRVMSFSLSGRKIWKTVPDGPPSSAALLRT